MTDEMGWLRRHRNLLTGLLLMLAAWVIYLPTMRYGFVYYDDVRILLNHPELYGQPKLSADLHAIFATEFPREEPLLVRDISWALDSRIFGFGNAFGYHLDNVLLHGIVVALLFAFLLTTTRRYGFTLAVSIVWLLLAVHVEPVAWIMGRKDILSALFMLLALCTQTKRLTANSATAKWCWYAATLAFFAAGLLSKISVLTFPLVLLLHAVFFPFLRGERQPSESILPLRMTLLREAFLFLPAIAMSGFIYVWYQRILAQMGIFDRGYTAHGLAHFWNLLMVNPFGFWLYLRQIFLPQHLAVLYTWPTLHNPYPASQIVISLATVLAFVVAGMWLFLRRKDIFFYYAVFFALMVPYLNLIYIGIWVADRYVYFSTFCVLAIAVQFLGEALLQKRSSLLRISALTICVVFTGINVCQTFLYQPKWRDGETLWQYHLTLSQPSPAAYENLAACYYAKATAQLGTPQMAVLIRKMSIVVDAGLARFWPDHQQPPPPDTSFLFFLQSIVQEVTGKPEAALASLLTSDRLHPKFDSTSLNLARLYRKLANAATDPKQKETYARDAQERFAEYIALTFRGRPAPPEVQKEFADIKAEYAKLPQLPDSKLKPGDK